MRDLIRFPSANLDMTDNPADSAAHIADRINRTDSISTAFSGVCAETVSMNIMNSQLEVRTGAPVKHPEYLYCIDKDTDCLRECSVLPNGPKCKFKHLEDFASDTLTYQLAQESLPYDADRLVSMCRETGALRLDAQCFSHPQRKRCRLRRAGGHLGGLPCTDFTTWGACRRLGGPTAIAAAIWIAMRLLLLEPWIIVEEVITFPVEFLERYLGCFYTISTTVVDNMRLAVQACPDSIKRVYDLTFVVNR